MVVVVVVVVVDVVDVVDVGAGVDAGATGRRGGVPLISSSAMIAAATIAAEPADNHRFTVRRLPSSLKTLRA